jgi:hypothetical protein
MPYFVLRIGKTQQTNQSAKKVTSWPIMKLGTTLTTIQKDTSIPEKPISSVKTLTRTWGVVWVLMGWDNRYETPEKSHFAATEECCLSLEPTQAVLLD